MLDIPDYDFVKSEDLHKEVSENLQVKYLSSSTQELDEVKGIFLGSFNRPFGVMTMEIKGQVKNVHFLVITGSPKTYISKEVLNSYGLTIPNQDETFAVRLNKRHIMASVTPDGFYLSDLNILGTDYLHLHKSKLFLNFYTGDFTIKFDDKIDTTQKCTE